MKEESKIYAVIDTNVLVSSLFSPDGLSNPAKIIRLIFNGVVTPLYNHEIIEEYRDVLSRDKFCFNPDVVDNLLEAFTGLGIEVDRTSITDEIFPDSDDIVFYEVTMSVEDAFLVTGNIKHFPQKPFVVTPSQMIHILSERGLI